MDELLFKKLRRLTWFGTGCAVLALSITLYVVLMSWQLWLLLPVALLAALTAGLETERRKIRLLRLPGSPDDTGKDRFDKYARHSSYAILFMLWQFPMAAIDSFRIVVSSREVEWARGMTVALIELVLVSFFVIKNLRMLASVCETAEFGNLPAYKRVMRRAVLSALVYWFVAGVVWFLFDRIFVLDILTFFSAVYFFMTVRFHVKVLRGVVYKPRKFNKWVVAAVAVPVCAVLLYSWMSRDHWLTQPYINSVPYIAERRTKIAYDDDTGVYTVTKPAGEFRILQLTDIHIGGSVLSYDKDDLALKTVFELLKATKPDLVVVTGDLSFPMGVSSFSFNNTASVQQFAAFMRNTGIPWAFTYGNHDTEAIAATGADTLDELYRALSWKTSRTLLYPYVQPEITGRSNQLIELRNEDGALVQALFLLDSNAYMDGGLNNYDYIRKDQIDWYAAEVARLSAEAGKTVPSLMFFHIPLPEYRTAYELAQSGDPSVTWHYGTNGEGISCSTGNDGLFDTIVGLGSTKAVFCGHDHYNNASITYRGVRLTYGMSIDWLVEPGIARSMSQRGATLITVADDGSFGIRPVPLESLDKPDSGRK
ncbi:MAG: metallophosphoesterase family protein [Clostridia bacterium]|nr:metallophosphoesterase family protein [Clostridia bacterium]